MTACWLFSLTGAGALAATNDLFLDDTSLTAPALATQSIDLYLQVQVNGGKTTSIAHFLWGDGQLWASHAELEQLKFKLPASTPDPVRLADLPGLVVDYDAGRQFLSLRAPLSLLDLPTTRLNAVQVDAPVATASPGLLVNYDLYAQHNRLQQGMQSDAVSAFLEARAFDNAGVLTQTQLLRSGYDGQDWQNDGVRMDTTWQTDFPEQMYTLKLGDTLTSALSWTRSTRVAGLQFGRDFSLQPYRVTTPLQSFVGRATLPSTVELYVNGQRTYQSEVPAGRFEIDTRPPAQGVGNANLVLTNALGERISQSVAFYNASNLLNAGLTDWSSTLGVVREDYGLASFHYGDEPVWSGSWRKGLSDRVTAETHGEATNGLWNAGVGGAWLVGLAGVLHGSWSASRNRSAAGSQFGAGYDWNDQRYSVSLNALGAQPGYADVATRYGAAPPRFSGQASFGYHQERLGNLGLSYVQLQYQGMDTARYANASWFKIFRQRLLTSVSVNRSLDQAHDMSVFINVSYRFDQQKEVYASVNRRDRAVETHLGARQQVSAEGGVGWNLDVGDQHDGNSGQDRRSGTLEAAHLGEYGQQAAGVSVDDASTLAYASARGALVFMQHDWFAARSVPDAFAVVSTNGIAGVPVTLGNNPVAATDAKGLALVPQLNAWQRNLIGIKTLQLPANMRIGETQKQVAPKRRSGTLVAFDVQPVNAALILLVDSKGAALPPGSSAWLESRPAQVAVVGYGGEVYFDTLTEHNVMHVTTTSGQQCEVQFGRVPPGEAIPQLGPFTCVTQQEQ